MAQNVKFIKGDTAKINGASVTDGQLLYNTTTGQHYIDNESTRVEVGKPVVNTMAEVSAITADYVPCGTKPVKELISSLNNTKDSLVKPPNYNNLLTTITPEVNGGAETYTAIQDCWIVFCGYANNGKASVLYIDNAEIARAYAGASIDVLSTSMIYVKKDSVVKILNTTNFAKTSMKIYSTI